MVTNNKQERIDVSIRSTPSTALHTRRPATEQRSTEQRIAEQAIRLFSQKGYEATGIREIAACVGITTASLYHYADSKEEILVSIMEKGLLDLRDNAERIVSTHQRPLARLSELVRMHVGFHATRQQEAIVIDTEFRSLTGTRRAHIRRLRTAYEAYWRTAVAQGNEESVLLCSDIPLTVYALLGMCNGVAVWFSENGRESVNETQQYFADLALALVRGTAVPKN